MIESRGRKEKQPKSDFVSSTTATFVIVQGNDIPTLQKSSTSGPIPQTSSTVMGQVHPVHGPGPLVDFDNCNVFTRLDLSEIIDAQQDLNAELCALCVRDKDGNRRAPEEPMSVERAEVEYLLTYYEDVKAREKERVESRREEKIAI